MSITCSRRSSTPASTIWRRRRSRWGRGDLRPLITRRTQIARVNLERLRANAIEACEQCGVIWAPEVAAPETLEKTLARWPPERLIVFCDEEAPQASPLDALGEVSAEDGVGLLVGPEGGFDDDERAAILASPRVLRLSLGPQILRADTAAVAALALIQATLGDWPKGGDGEGSDFRPSEPPRPFCRHDLAPFPLAMNCHHFGRRQGVTGAMRLACGTAPRLRRRNPRCGWRGRPSSTA